jgi:hypothetical protein
MFFLSEDLSDIGFGPLLAKYISTSSFCQNRLPYRQVRGPILFKTRKVRAPLPPHGFTPLISHHSSFETV